ncbi:MAG: ZIP family metal transporter [Acidobacteriota bacterium]
MKQWIRGLLPIGLLAVLLTLFFYYGPLGIFLAAFPPVEELTIERIVLPEPNHITLHVINGGPHPVTIAQVTVDDAFWQYWTEPENHTISRLAQLEIHIPYPWVEGETHEVSLLTSTGLTFSREIPVATQSPLVDSTYLWTFSLLGIYAGVIPVFLGLLWYPFLREMTASWLSFFLSLTVGLLVFLAVDTFHEALESADAVPGAFQGVSLVAIGIVGTLLTLLYLSHLKAGRSDKESPQGRYWTAFMIALGIGFHNLGEGLAIGSSYAVGEIALGTFLVVGFTLHNITEGLGIVAPIAKDTPSILRLVGLGSIAGMPTILGTWIGGFSFSPLWVVLFLSIGVGAILQVIYELTLMLVKRQEIPLNSAYNLSGFLLGLGIMYGTGLLVVA